MGRTIAAALKNDEMHIARRRNDAPSSVMVRIIEMWWVVVTGPRRVKV